MFVLEEEDLQTWGKSPKIFNDVVKPHIFLEFPPPKKTLGKMITHFYR